MGSLFKLMSSSSELPKAVVDKHQNMNRNEKIIVGGGRLKMAMDLDLVCSLLDMAFALAFVFLTFFDRFIGLPFFNFKLGAPEAGL